MDEDQVAFVAELGVEGGADGGFGGGSLHSRRAFDGLGGDAFAAGGRGGAPGFPVETEELMEEGWSLQG